jgi:lysophospholipase L1-like esterase
VVLGDSFTFGLGVTDEETYCQRLEAALGDTEVINLGANGYGTDQQFLMWLRHGVEFAPDLVILAFYLPNMDRNVLRIREFPKPRFYVESDGSLRLGESPTPSIHEFLSRFHPDRPFLRLIEVIGSVQRRFGASGEGESFEEKTLLTRRILEALVTSVRAAGAQICLMVVPHERGRRYANHDRIEQRLELAGQELAVPVLNLTDSISAAEATVGPMYAENGHWNSGGHALVVELLTAFLEQHQLLR